MIFASVYPLYLKELKKMEDKEELNLFLIKWLTGFDERDFKYINGRKSDFQNFF